MLPVRPPVLQNLRVPRLFPGPSPAHPRLLRGGAGPELNHVVYVVGGEAAESGEAGSEAAFRNSGTEMASFLAFAEALASAGTSSPRPLPEAVVVTLGVHACVEGDTVSQPRGVERGEKFAGKLWRSDLHEALSPTRSSDFPHDFCNPLPCVAGGLFLVRDPLSLLSSIEFLAVVVYFYFLSPATLSIAAGCFDGMIMPAAIFLRRALVKQGF